MAIERGLVDFDGLAGRLAAQVDKLESYNGWMSTQEAGWIVIAAQSLSSGKDAGNGVTLSGAPLSGPVSR